MIALVYTLLLTTLYLFHEKIYYFKNSNHIENKSSDKNIVKIMCSFQKFFLRILAQMQSKVPVTRLFFFHLQTANTEALCF